MLAQVVFYKDCQTSTRLIFAVIFDINIDIIIGLEVTVIGIRLRSIFIIILQLNDWVCW